MTIRATGRGRTEAIAVHCHHAVMLAAAATACRQRLLRRQQWQRKRSHQQNEQQAGKRPAHGKRFYYRQLQHGSVDAQEGDGRNETRLANEQRHGWRIQVFCPGKKQRAITLRGRLPS